jgi:peptide/nickel transport system ATP-binding protein
VPSGQEITGCPFHPRCPRKLGKICETTRPPVVQASKDHSFTCHIPLEQLAKVRSPLATGPSEESRDQTVDQ